MLKKTIVASSVLACLPLLTGAMYEKEISLNGDGYTPNYHVVPPVLVDELSRTELSYDYKKQEYNHEFKAAKAVYDRVIPQYRIRLALFRHEAYLNSKFAQQVPEGKTTLLSIIENSPYDSTLVRTQEDGKVLMRDMTNQVFSKYFNVALIDKKAQKLTFKITNRSRLDIASVEGNLRIKTTVDDRVIHDQSITIPVKLEHGQQVDKSVLIGNRWYNWVQTNTGLTSKFVTSAVTLKSGERIAIDDIYQELATDFGF